MIRKRKEAEAKREKLVENRAQRIALQTNTDLKLVEETLLNQQAANKPTSRFDSVAVQ